MGSSAGLEETRDGRPATGNKGGPSGLELASSRGGRGLGQAYRRQTKASVVSLGRGEVDGIVGDVVEGDGGGGEDESEERGRMVGEGRTKWWPSGG